MCDKWKLVLIMVITLARFLLARLYINSLASKTTDKAIKEALRELETKPGSSDDEKKSKALDDAYEEILQRIEEQGHERCQLAKQVLTWISCSKRRLTCSELQHAIAIEEGTSELDPDNLTDITLMPSVCAGLVIIDERSGVIRLIHHTAEEYFDRTWKHWFPDAQTDMAEACTTYLSFGAFESGCCQTLTSLEERFKFYAFYQYASQNWGHHASKSFIEGERPILDFLRNDTKVSACAQAMEYRSKEFFDYQHGTKTTGLHLAAYFGLWKSTSNLLESNAEVETKDHYERSPLLYAAEKGYERVVKRLLDGYANVNSTDRFGNFPLLSAAENGHDAVVKLLLEANADLSLRDWWGSSPLLSAAYNGHTAVVKVLLDSDVYADSKDNEGTTPLIIAANHGHEAVVRMLLDNDAFVDSRDDNGQTPLSYAAQNGHEAVVRSLLEMNSDVESKDEHGRTPLSHAAEKGHKTVVKLLLDNNAVIASRDNKGRTPFLYAVHRKHEETVDLLLETTAHREPEYLMTYEELIDNLQNMDADSVSEREGGSRFEDYSEGDAATTGPLARAITL
jgi:ankyrin repeat protein